MLKKMFLMFLLSLSFAFANSLSEIRDSGVIRIATLTNNPPFSKLLDDGTLEGFEVDFAQRISKDLFGDKGGRVELIPISSNQRIEFLQDNKADLVIGTFTITDDRLKMIDFSMPYFSVSLGFLTRKSDNINKIGDLNGKTIITPSGSTGESIIKKKGGHKIVTCLSSAEGYKLLKDGKGDAFLDDNIAVLAYPVIDQSVQVNIKSFGSSDFLGIGVKKGNKELLDAVNAELINLSKEGFFKKSFDEFLNPFYKGTAEKKYFLLDDIYSIFG